MFNLIKLSKYALLHDLPFQLASHWHFPLFSITKFCNLWLQALKLLKQFFYFTALEISLLRTVRRKTFVLCWTNWSPTVSWHQASTHFWHWTVKSHLEQGTRDVMIHAQLRFPVLINLWKTVSYIINESFLQDYILAVLFCKLKSLGHLFSQSPLYKSWHLSWAFKLEITIAKNSSSYYCCNPTMQLTIDLEAALIVHYFSNPIILLSLSFKNAKESWECWKVVRIFEM